MGAAAAAARPQPAPERGPLVAEKFSEALHCREALLLAEKCPRLACGWYILTMTGFLLQGPGPLIPWRQKRRLGTGAAASRGSLQGLDSTTVKRRHSPPNPTPTPPHPVQQLLGWRRHRRLGQGPHPENSSPKYRRRRPGTCVCEVVVCVWGRLQPTQRAQSSVSNAGPVPSPTVVVARAQQQSLCQWLLGTVSAWNCDD